jgi:sulfoxide reductase heme-binding subunit YedZ
MPWNDPAGRFSPLKAAAFALTLYPALWLLARWAIGDLGARPITEAIHRSGDWAVRFLILTLAVTPARALLNWSRVVLLRRMLGVAAAAYAGLHLLLYVADQKWNLWTVATEIALRFYLTIGFVVLLALAALAITSTDGWQRHLRQRWKLLHRLVFPATALALFHYALQSKINVTDALAWAGLFVWLALWRRLPRPQQTRLLALLALTVAATLATAVIEVAWYGLATKVDPWRVLAANLGFDPARRPAARVLLAGLAVIALTYARRLLAARRKPA